MILELAILNIKDGKSAEFEKAFSEAQEIIKSAKGYISHNLQKSLKASNCYLLLVKWQTLNDHVNGFRKSPEYQKWKKLLHNFYQPFPEVIHFEKIENSSSELIL
jgi:heme-degrading monooxygenase HmoA